LHQTKFRVLGDERNKLPHVAEEIDAKQMLGALSEVWTEELTSGGRIEIENVLVLEVQRIDWGEQRGMLSSGEPSQIIHRVVARPSKHLRERLEKLEK
jgi:nucleoid DNA-binding protein